MVHSYRYNVVEFDENFFKLERLCLLRTHAGFLEERCDQSKGSNRDGSIRFDGVLRRFALLRGI